MDRGGLDRDPLDPQAIAQRLRARRAELTEISAESAEARKTVELDQTRVGRLSRMDALQGQAMSIATDRRRQAELQRIEKALARLDSGDYGFCLSCGEEIAPKRLKLDPTVAVCVDCAGNI